MPRFCRAGDPLELVPAGFSSSSFRTSNVRLRRVITSAPHTTGALNHSAHDPRGGRGDRRPRMCGASVDSLMAQSIGWGMLLVSQEHGEMKCPQAVISSIGRRPGLRSAPVWARRLVFSSVEARGLALVSSSVLEWA